MPWGQPRAAPLEEAPAGRPLRQKPEATSGLSVANLSAAEPPKVRPRPKGEARAGKAHPRPHLGCTPGWGPPAGLGRECREEPGDGCDGGQRTEQLWAVAAAEGGLLLAGTLLQGALGRRFRKAHRGVRLLPGLGQPLFKFQFCGILGKDPTFQSFSRAL